MAMTILKYASLIPLQEGGEGWPLMPYLKLQQVKVESLEALQRQPLAHQL